MIHLMHVYDIGLHSCLVVVYVCRLLCYIGMINSLL